MPILLMISSPLGHSLDRMIEYKMFLDSRCSYYFVFRYISRPKILQVREDTREVDLFLLFVFCFLLPTVLVGIQIHTNIFVVNTITTMLMI